MRTAYLAGLVAEDASNNAALPKSLDSTSRRDDLDPGASHATALPGIADAERSYRAISREVRRAVARQGERFVLDHIARGVSFAVETTLRTSAAIEQADSARKNGFVTQMRFVATDSVSENIARVAQRSQAGGHAAWERELRAIHRASIANLPRAIATFERVRIEDVEADGLDPPGCAGTPPV